ncbi:MAG: helix-turn-helix transcriptional regulator [Gemmatimonadaceae bacterium]
MTEMATLASAIDAADRGSGTTIFVSGEGGVGKTRLVGAAAELARERRWATAIGQAYPVEMGVPYALFADALTPVVSALDPSALAVMTRGAAVDLAQLFPVLAARTGAPARGGPSPEGTAAQLKAQLLWTATQLIGQLARRRPLLLVLENLQWADASSLELLHFVARQLATERIVILCTYNDAERDANATLRETERSLIALDAARALPLAPLSHAETQTLVDRMFGADRRTTVQFTALLYGWTRGNPFFHEQSLNMLIDSGRVYERNGAWLGWDLDAIELPRTVRDALLGRLARLTPAARAVADIVAVLGTRTTYAALGAITAQSADELLAALDELRHARVLDETSDGDAIVYDFAHPMLRDVLYTDLGIARRRVLHSAIADRLERFYAGAALANAGELAFHFVRGDSRLAPKAVTYLVTAGRAAQAKHAYREAADYLTAALASLDARRGDPVTAGDRGATDAGVTGDAPDPSSLANELAQVRQRLGEYDVALALWKRSLAAAEAAGDSASMAAIHREMGLSAYWSGRYAEAIAMFDSGLAAAAQAGDDATAARLRIAKALCLQSVGDAPNAKREAKRALTTAKKRGEPALLGRAHRTLLLLYTDTGPAETARRHGRAAVELAEAAGDRGLAWATHRAMALLEAFTSHEPAMARHLAESELLADELHSPLLKLWTSEIAIEYDAGRGEWDTALARGERSLALARTLGQQTLVPRLLVWTGLIYLARADDERAKSYLFEAWTLSGADRPPGGPTDVHAIVPAHIGLTHYYVAMRAYRKALEIGEAGLRVADRCGYSAWAIYRLLPMITEAALWLRDVPLARRYGARLRRDSELLDHPLGIAWADCCDALIAMIRRDARAAVPLLRGAAESLEAVPFTFDAARVRRKLAWVLWKSGDVEGARAELRRAHDTFAGLGAARELSDTRGLLRALGVRPPTRQSARTATGLTDREAGIIRLVAAHQSNKEIGKALGISSRTVSTHLSHIFAKLAVGSRGELVDVARQRGFVHPAPPPA